MQAMEIVVDKRPLSSTLLGCSAATIGGVALFVTAPVPAPTGVEGVVKPLIDRLLGVLSMLKPSGLPHQAWLAGVPGEALAFAGAFFFALHVWRCTKIISDGDRSKTQDFAFALAGGQAILVVAFAAAFSYFDSVQSWDVQMAFFGRLGMSLWVQIAACGALCTGLPAILELFAFKVVDPAAAALIYCTIPLWGTCLSVIFLGDSFGLQSSIGGLIILAASMGPSVLEMSSTKDGEGK